MNKPNKENYYKLYRNVIVDTAINYPSPCHKCKINQIEFAVFLGDSKRMSTLYSNCCSDCLASVITEANNKGQEIVLNNFI